MSLIYAIADHFGEPDPRKIASLPADIILYWQAWFSLTGSIESAEPDIPPVNPPPPVIDQQCAEVMRMLK